MATIPRKRPDPTKALAKMPTGAPLYRIARESLLSLGRWRLEIARQFSFRKDVAGIPPEQDPFMAASNMATQFIPYVDAYIDQGGRFVLNSLGQEDADQWMIRAPQVVEAARTATLDLCEETIQNFLSATNREIDNVRQELAESIEGGETAGDAVNRVARWMNDESRWRARRIANTESARAFNYGQVASTEDLDFVAGYRWVLDSDACPLCHAVQRQCPVIPKGGTFAVNGKNSTYKKISTPPLHPNCRCTLVVVFEDEAPSEWPRTVQPDPETGYIKPSERDYQTAEDGGYESVAIGNAR
jgi:SPP1 gp7 family putative phage head morphogenesis protein